MDASFNTFREADGEPAKTDPIAAIPAEYQNEIRAFVEAAPKDEHLRSLLISALSSITNEDDLSWLVEGGFLKSPCSIEFLGDTKLEKIAGKDVFDHLWELPADFIVNSEIKGRFSEAIKNRIRKSTNPKLFKRVFDDSLELVSKSSENNTPANSFHLELAAFCLKRAVDDPEMQLEDASELRERLEAICIKTLNEAKNCDGQLCEAIRILPVQILREHLSLFKDYLARKDFDDAVSTALERFSEIDDDELDAFCRNVLTERFGSPLTEKALYAIFPERISDEALKANVEKHPKLLKEWIMMGASPDESEYATKLLLKADPGNLRFLQRLVARKLGFTLSPDGIINATKDLDNEKIQLALFKRLSLASPAVDSTIAALKLSTSQKVTQKLLTIVRNMRLPRGARPKDVDDINRIINAIKVLDDKWDNEVKEALLTRLAKCSNYKIRTTAGVVLSKHQNTDTYKLKAILTALKKLINPATIGAVIHNIGTSDFRQELALLFVRFHFKEDDFLPFRPDVIKALERSGCKDCLQVATSLKLWEASHARSV